ncbi:response regulator [Fulvivirga ulvae]|uniref:response regulator n=1 Tax=Fulvivirga ulvae TaxID=2904245 RepID=UPI001F2135B6|nr:response regulator [Fulvivirga ulvae]UII31118.1 response regulator [Fulvivirga ulvae]
MQEEKKRILVADDDPSILDVLEIMLAEIGGYQVETTANGKSVLELKDDLPDLILLDLWMSGMDGREICTKLKSQDTTRAIPVIIFSANRDIQTIAETAGADDYIAKPFQMNELLEKVRNCIADK